ncbi:trypsin-1 [Ceratitis capitata]|uniref:(Mediterranean fruit fly) hypothetical protein n=2 Tax=Ceratitis capitata TaxID=7213 RepID=A0A811VB10_CERCA|nr:trypsin-1 [Ceratitis capitata]CAD7012576.1 unnamed protein product [Ceratitis capitata]
MLGQLIVVALLAFGCANADTTGTVGGRIVGGTDAEIRQYPHQISLRYNGRHFCGGSIYRSKIILTATHCVSDEDPTNITIVAGITALKEQGVEVPVVKIIAHEKYNALNDYDVALLVLAQKLEYNELIQPIALAKERPVGGSPVTVTGWGTLVSGGVLSETLQQVTVDYVEQSTCRRSYFLLLTKRMLCAAVEGGGQDACQGDSGGPLIVGNEQLGVVSWGFGCGSSNFPGVYSSVPDLADWIEATADAIESDDIAVDQYSFL